MKSGFPSRSIVGHSVAVHSWSMGSRSSAPTRRAISFSRSSMNAFGDRLSPRNRWWNGHAKTEPVAGHHLAGRKRLTPRDESTMTTCLP